MIEMKVFNYNGCNIIFETNGEIMINASDMIKAFPAKRMNDFTMLNSTASFCSLLQSKAVNPVLIVNHGGIDPGTWMHQKLALKFAAWLSVEFEMWVYDRIEELLVTGKTEIKPSIPDFNNPAEAARAWANEFEAKQLAESQVKELAPKAEVFDQISSAENLLTLNDAAKVLGKGRNKLMEYLRSVMILRVNNTPYQEFINAGYFEVKVKPFKKGDSNFDYPQTFVTGKGLIWLKKRLSVIETGNEF